jgi:hypothetical protein
VRLTYTDSLSEFDPAPSPDGRYLVVAGSSFVHPASLSEASWQYRVIDMFLGRTVARFEIPDSCGLLRPAGGFQITWLTDGSAFFGQVPKENFDWEIYKFDLETGTVKFITEGFGIVLNEDASRLATSVAGQVRVMDLLSGRANLLIKGQPLSFTQANQLLVGQENSLRLINGDSGKGEELFDFVGIYSDFAWSPKREKYAFILLQQATWFVVVVTAEHAFISEFKMPGVIDSLDFLTEDKLLVSYLKPEGNFAIAELSLEGHMRIVVDSWVNDYGVRVVR